MQCPVCGEELTGLTVCYNYSIDYNQEQEAWTKSIGEVIYSCSKCEVILDIHEIEDILRQVDEL